MNIQSKLKNDDFYEVVEELQARLHKQLQFWDHDPLQKHAAQLELESFQRLISDERMIEVWQKMIEPAPSKAIVILHRAYQLRGNWYFLTYKGIKDKKHYKDRQKQYEKLKSKFLDFLHSEVYEEAFEELKTVLDKVDRCFELPHSNNMALYNRLPRKMRSKTAEDVYMQIGLVEEMLFEFDQPNYRLVATIVDVLLDKSPDDLTSVDSVQHNTASIAKARVEGHKKI